MLPERDQQLSLQSTLSMAREMAGKYEWLEAATLYDDAVARLQAEGNDFFHVAEAKEKLAYCYERAAFQASSLDEFIGRMRLAAGGYQESAELFDRSGSSEGEARANFARLRGLYEEFWIARSCEEKIYYLDECRRLGKEVLGYYETAGDRPALGRACNVMAAILLDRLDLQADSKGREEIILECLSLTSRAIQVLSSLQDKSELATAYALASYACSGATDIHEAAQKQTEFVQKSLEYGRKANELSLGVTDSNVIAEAFYALGCAFDLLGDGKSASEQYLRQLEYAKISKDNWWIGWALDCYASDLHVLTRAEPDPEKKKHGYEDALRFTEEASKYFALTNHDFAICCSLVTYAESCLSMAREVEGTRSEAVETLKKAIAVARTDLQRAEQSGIPTFRSGVRNCLSKSLYYFSTMETDSEKRRALLEEAMKLREERIEIARKAFPYDYWGRTVDLSSLAMIKAGLAQLEKVSERKIDLLHSATRDMESCIENAERALKTVTDPKGLLSGLGSYYDTYARVLSESYPLTSNPAVLNKLVKILDGAIDAYSKVGLAGRAAEAYWRKGAVLHKLGLHLEGEISFTKAAESYESAARLIPGLKDLYEDYALYMKAWAAISKARNRHGKEDYDGAKTHYAEASEYLRKSRRWSYLSENYRAWAILESGEALSRAERTEEAQAEFINAAKSFQESRLVLEQTVSTISDPDEREEALQLLGASELRREYCEGRAALEEGRVSDKSGDHMSSAKRYSTAAAIFENIAAAMASEAESRELVPIIQLSRAWEKMALAEAKASAELYAEACTLFTTANETSVTERTGLLALGHSYVCRALESGTRYESSRDVKLHSVAKEYLETAGTYYAKAGFPKASEWATATQVLFDAFLYANNVQNESDPERKTKLYGLAETCFMNASELFDRAGYSGKKNEAIRMAEGIRRKREIAVSLLQALRAPTLLSATASFATPTGTVEDAVGFETFEHALMQANLSISDNDVGVAQEVYLDLELVNAGRAPAILNKIEGVLPGGFVVKQPPEKYLVEDNSINLGGRKLEPLKSERIRMVLKAQNRGVVYLRARLLYQDESRQQKSYDLKPLTITVRELGLSGWLKGPSR